MYVPCVNGRFCGELPNDYNRFTTDFGQGKCNYTRPYSWIVKNLYWDFQEMNVTFTSRLDHCMINISQKGIS